MSSDKGELGESLIFSLPSAACACSINTRLVIVLK